MKRLSFVFAVIALVACCTACGNRVGTNSAVSASNEASASAGTQNSPKQTQEQNSGEYKAGTYKVGTDCPAGEYKLMASGNGYYCVYPDTAKEDILENSNFDKCEYITVTDGQCLLVKGASFIAKDKAKPASGTLSGQGKYLVGFDCPAGEYKLTASSSGMGYYCIYNDSAAGADIIQNNNFDGSDYCTVTDGQYLTLSRCTAEQS